MPIPRVSVVVSSFERPAALSRLLTALAGQTLRRSDYEVIVVDNGSGPETAAVLQRAREELDLSLRTIRHERTLGPAGGRNSGWRQAVALLIAFTDDDCVPTPSWLERLLAAAGTEPDPMTIIQGATAPIPEQLAALNTTLFARIVSVQAADGRFETCNILYSRALLEQLGGFDERFLPRGLSPRPVGEDTDLGWRARKAGAQVIFISEATVHHEVARLGPLAKLAHQTRWGGAVHVFRIHPEARAEILFRRYFWNVWHYMLLQAIVAVALPRVLRRPLLMRYLRAMRARARECSAGCWAVPYLIIEDAIEAAVLVSASIKDRTPLL